MWLKIYWTLMHRHYAMSLVFSVITENRVQLTAFRPPIYKYTLYKNYTWSNSLKYNSNLWFTRLILIIMMVLLCYLAVNLLP